MLKKYLFFSMTSLAWAVGAVQLFETLTNFSTQWYWWVLATIYTVTLNDIFIHQVGSHSTEKINTSSWTYKLMVFLVSVDNTIGTLTNYCVMHRHHHLKSDTNEDLTLPKKYWYSRNLLAPWVWLENEPIKITDQKNYMDTQKNRYAYLINDPWTAFCEQNRLWISMAVWALLFVVAPIILFKIVFMGKFLMSIYMCLSGNFGHMKLPLGYRNFDTKDNSHNNLLFHYLALGLNGSMLQNNHHGMNTNKTISARWFELDVAKLIRWPLQQLILKKTN